MSTGVLTKLDIMDRGTDAVAMLRGAVVPLRLGYVACINRTQADVAASTSITSAHKAEADFFDSRSEYKGVRSQCGVPILRHRCASFALLPLYHNVIRS